MCYISMNNIILMLFNTPFPTLPKGYYFMLTKPVLFENQSGAPKTFENKMQCPEVEDNTTLIRAKCLVSI